MLSNIFYNNNLMDDVFQTFMKPYKTHTNRYPLMKTDIIDLDDHYRLEMELAGYEKKDIKVSYRDGYLTITASKNKKEENQASPKYLHREIYADTVSRKLFLGDYLKEDDFSASFEHDILTLDYPKEKELSITDEVRYIPIG